MARSSSDARYGRSRLSLLATKNPPSAQAPPPEGDIPIQAEESRLRISTLAQVGPQTKEPDKKSKVTRRKGK
jgi:hypothetical protein